MRLLPVLLLCFVYTQQREEHFIDVKELVKDTIQAIGQLPRAAAMGIPTMNFTTPAPAPQLYHLFKLPADIMTDLAVNAGYMDGSTAAPTPKVPWIVTRDSGDVYRNGPSGVSQSSENSGLLPISSLLPRMLGTPNVPASQLPQPPPMTQPSSSSGVESFRHLSQLPAQSVSTPRYAYRPVVQPDGQTLFVPVLLPPTEPPTLEELMRQKVLAQAPQETEPVTSTSRVSSKPVRLSSERYEANTFPPMVNPFYDRNTMKGLMSLTKEALQTAINTNIPNMSVPNFMQTTLLPQILTTPRPFNSRVRKISSETEHQVDAINGPEDERSTLIYEAQAVPIPFNNVYNKKVITNRKSFTSVYNVDDTTTGENMKAPMIDERLAFQTREDFEKKEKNFLKKKIKKIVPQAASETELDAEAVREFDHMSLTHTPNRNVNIRRVIPKADIPSEEFLGQMHSIPTDSEEAESETREQLGSSGRHVRHRAQSIKTYVVDRKHNQDKNGFTEPTEPINKQIEIEMERLGRLEVSEDDLAEEKVEDEEFLSDIEKQAELLTHKPTRVQTFVRKTIMPVKINEKPSRIHCLNILNFSKQFGVSDVMAFATEKCEYIENYYPRLPCRNVDLYMKECAQYY